ncbi:hypothetical protein ACFUJU_14855 [Streptomyces sp. NPDC057235]|uniref:hypothetical protein n=1 Tax=Streptomyces sp. NPDC057235 TaxID=3346058 RepID=UPI003644C34A
MRLADLMGARVSDRDGREIGHVSDVRLREYAIPTRGPADTELRVEGLVVAARRRGRLIAYDHRPVDGPWPLAWLARWAARNVLWAPWSAVTDHEPPVRLGDAGTVRLAVAGIELAPLVNVHDDWSSMQKPAGPRSG